MSLTLDGPLVTTEWLAENYMEEDIRIIDCTCYLEKSKYGPVPKSGKPEWEKGHIPNSIHIDLLNELSDNSSKLPFMMPSKDQFELVMSIKGIGNDHTVITYDREKTTWASRVRLMFLSFEFEKVAVLDGGWKKWTGENRPVSLRYDVYNKTRFNASENGNKIFTDKNDIIRVIEEGSGILINTLDNASYRDGHIPKSINIPSAKLIDEETNSFLPVDALKEIYEKAGIKKEDRIITYCGGGISASCGATALMLAGFDNVSVFDGSMAEWLSDSNLPVEKGDR